MKKSILLEQMNLAIADSVDHVSKGGLPFAAVVLDERGKIVGRGVNRVSARNDPTAHAEIEALRDACDHLGTARIQGATLLATGEPCALCLLAIAYAGITSVHFSVGSDQAARHGFDYRNDRQRISPPGMWSPPLTLEKLDTPTSLDPFLLFLERQSISSKAAPGKSAAMA